MGLTRRQVLWTTVALIAVFLGVIVVTSVLVSALKSTSIRGTQVNNTETLDSSAQTLKIIQSCTTPGEPCYERGQKQTADAIQSINEVAVYAAACADQRGVQGEDEIYACVVRRLAEDQPNH